MSSEPQPSHLERFTNLSSHGAKVAPAIHKVLEAVSGLTLPNQAKVLTSIAADIMEGVQNRNAYPDVNEAVDTLRKALTALQEMRSDLDG